MNCQFYVGKNVELHKLVKNVLEKRRTIANFNFSDYPWIVIQYSSCGGNTYKIDNVKVIDVAEFLDMKYIKDSQYYIGNNKQLKDIIAKKLQSFGITSYVYQDPLKYSWLVIFNTPTGIMHQYRNEKSEDSFPVGSITEILDL